MSVSSTAMTQSGSAYTTSAFWERLWRLSGVGFNDRFWFDFAGHPHTEQLHTIERYTRKDFGTMVVETTIIDPGAYVKPFKVAYTAILGAKDELMEYICAESPYDYVTGKNPQLPAAERADF